MKILFLDDMEARHKIYARKVSGYGHEILHVWNATEALEALQKLPQFDLAMLDHDLAEAHYRVMMNAPEEGFVGAPPPAYGPGTGMDVVDFIALMAPDRRPKQVICHTLNYPRGKEMVARLRDAGVTAHYIPFKA